MQALSRGLTPRPPVAAAWCRMDFAARRAAAAAGQPRAERGAACAAPVSLFPPSKHETVDASLLRAARALLCARRPRRFSRGKAEIASSPARGALAGTDQRMPAGCSPIAAAHAPREGLVCAPHPSSP